MAAFLHPVPRGGGLGDVRGQRHWRVLRAAVPEALYPLRRGVAAVFPAELRRAAGGKRGVLHPADRKAVGCAAQERGHPLRRHPDAAGGLHRLCGGQHNSPFLYFNF